ncbi:MAG TPA: Calx-beta domain-containing protein [Tepidisphaeraceae bacterium]|nr:Calx-beta domain-containing protein [Tepidisphaeraceae bacterium]
MSYPTGASPQDVVSGDVNGDGRLDLVTTNYDADTVSVLLGNANGTFAAPLTSATGSGPHSVAVGDFNADGKPDLATSNNYDLSVLLGNGNGTYQAPTTLSINGYPAGVAVGDVNADGKLDLVAASNYFYGGGWGYGYYPSVWSGRMNVLLGNGNGSFAAAKTTHAGASSGGIAAVALADFNGDGKLDAATVDPGEYRATGGIAVAYGDGAGGLSPTSAAASMESPVSLTAGDVNGDGKPDLLTGSGNDSISVVLNNGGGNFAPAQQYPAGSYPRTIKLADFNGDAKIDLVTANSGSSSVNVLLGTGSGTFRPGFSVAVGSNPIGVATGDFNGDGRADLASANRGSNSTSVLLNDGAWPDVNSPSITISDITVTEGNSGTVNAALTVTLSAASTQTITVNYATADGTATVAGGDYVAASGTLTFSPGQLSKTINVQVNGDRIAESTETLNIVLSGATNAFIGDATGVVTVRDDEPTINIDDYSATEGHSGTKAFTFTVRLSAASDAPVSVNFSTAEGDTAYWNWGWYYYPPPEATAGTDFQSNTGTVTFAAGQTSKTITVLVNGDREGEQDETFSVDLSNAVGAHLGDRHALGTILNDDPFVSVFGGSVIEGHSGTKLLPFTFTLSNASDVPVTVNYATSDGSATSISGDYVARTSTVTFAAGETSKVVNITVNGDRRGEGDESVNMSITAATNAGIDNGWGTAFIRDDEPRITVNNVSITEGDRGTKLMTFTATLSAAYDQTVTVNYATKDGSALAGKDYNATSGTLTFLAGQTTKTFTVAIIGDKKGEYTESFYIRLTNASSNAWVEYEYAGIGTILDNDRR